MTKQEALQKILSRKNAVDVQTVIAEQQAKREQLRSKADNTLKKFGIRLPVQTEKKKEDYHAFS